MYKTIDEVPEQFRHMFYPPKVISHISFESAGELRPDFLLPQKRQEMLMELNMAFFLGETPEKSEEIKLLERLKYAYIVEDGHRYITYVDNETLKAYRLHDNSYYDGLICPLEEVPVFTFERWCRGMDL